MHSSKQVKWAKWKQRSLRTFKGCNLAWVKNKGYLCTNPLKQIWIKIMKSISQHHSHFLLIYHNHFFLFLTQWSSFSFLFQDLFIYIFFLFFFPFFSLGSSCHQFKLLFYQPPQLSIHQSFLFKNMLFKGLINNRVGVYKQEKFIEWIIIEFS